VLPAARRSLERTKASGDERHFVKPSQAAGRILARVREILETIDGWTREELRVVLATLVGTERSSPRDPGSAMAVSERGDVAGSLTGGCVEPALVEEAREIFDGAAARLVTYGIEDDDAFEAGLPCGGTIHVFLNRLEADAAQGLATAVRLDEPVAFAQTVSGPEIGAQEIVSAEGRTDPELEGDLFVLPLLPRPRMYVFGALDHAAAVARAGSLLGFHVTVCDARERFLTRERFPEPDELVTAWPHEFLRSADVDERTAICVLTHDHKFDVPLLKEALAGPAGYIGALGGAKTRADREEKLRAEGVDDHALGRVHAPIGLDIGARTPEEVAIAVAAQIVALRRVAA
jgi:xanthine dehydrogenase accessory factor